MTLEEARDVRAGDLIVVHSTFGSQTDSWQYPIAVRVVEAVITDDGGFFTACVPHGIVDLRGYPLKTTTPYHYTIRGSDFLPGQ